MQPTAKNGDPVSIVRSDYMTNIRQGALDTLYRGCYLFGFGAENHSNIEGENQKDEHHLSFGAADEGKLEESK